MSNWTSQYKRCAIAHALTDYSDKSSVRLGNRAADGLRILGKEKVDKIALFELIDQDHPASLWAAHHLLEFHEPSDQEKTKAINRIEVEISKGGSQAMGERMFLDRYRKNKT